MIAPAGRPSAHALALAAVAILLLASAALLPLEGPPLALLACPFRAATGLPCPGCGFTRAFHFAVRGRFAEAVAFNPLGTLVALACGIHAIWTALRLAGLPYAPRLEDARGARWALAIALVANWIFVLLQGRP
jgi:Protein of unknown function (DUF2752)